MASGKCAFFDKGYCKNKDQCLNAHPLTDCQGDCEDKRTCKKRHRINCRNGEDCTWNSCDFLHKKTSQENKTGKLQKLREDITNEISEYDNKIDKFLGSINDRIEAIDDEYSNKLQETEEKFRPLTKQTEKTKNKLETLEEKYKFLQRQINKLVNSDQDQIEIEVGYDILEKANNQSLAGTNKSNGEENTEHIQTTETHEEEYECEICRKKFKSLNNMKKHDIKFHMKHGSNNENLYKCDQCNNMFKNKQEVPAHIIDHHLKCKTCARTFPNTKSLNVHITAIHSRGSLKHTIEREPSLKNHKIKK